MHHMSESVRAQLKRAFRQRGYFRVPNEQRRKRDGASYKKGYEVRLVADDEAQLLQLRSLLRRCGFKPGKPFSKSQQRVQPIYGKHAMEQFRRLLSE
jgi:hypothetical protein